MNLTDIEKALEYNNVDFNVFFRGIIDNIKKVKAFQEDYMNIEKISDLQKRLIKLEFDNTQYREKIFILQNENKLLIDNSNKTNSAKYDDLKKKYNNLSLEFDNLKNNYNKLIIKMESLNDLITSSQPGSNIDSCTEPFINISSNPDDK